MTTTASRKRTARTGDTARAAGRNGGALFPYQMITETTDDYKCELAAAYRYILSADWGRQ